MELKWETPEPRGNGRGRIDWKPVLDALRERPGEWALVAEDVSTSTATAIQNGKLGGAVACEFEATARGVKKNRAARMYARYVGGAK